MTEQEIIQGCRKQDRHSQQALYDKYSPKMFGVCKRYLKNHEDAEDVLVEGLFKAMSKIDMFKGAGSFEGWIRRIVVNEALMHLRKNNNFKMTVEISNIEIQSFITIQDELEALKLYIQLEQMRLRNSFSFEMILDNHLNTEIYEIPPMLIQPFVENSIWHGLNHLEHGGKVTIQIQKEGESLKCIIEDNGIGRVESAKIKSAKKVKRKSMGMNITTERMEIINNIYDTKNEIKIEDLYDDNHNATGTRVTLNIPL